MFSVFLKSNSMLSSSWLVTLSCADLNKNKNYLFLFWYIFNYLVWPWCVTITLGFDKIYIYKSKDNVEWRNDNEIGIHVNDNFHFYTFHVMNFVFLNLHWIWFQPVLPSICWEFININGIDLRCYRKKGSLTEGAPFGFHIWLSKNDGI